MLRSKNTLLAKQQPTVEQLTELETYLDSIKELAIQINQPITNLLVFSIGIPMFRVIHSSLLGQLQLYSGLDAFTGLLVPLLHTFGKNALLIQKKTQLGEEGFLRVVAFNLQSLVNENKASPEAAEQLFQMLEEKYREKYQDLVQASKFDVDIFKHLLIEIEFYLLAFIVLNWSSKHIMAPLFLKIFPHGIFRPKLSRYLLIKRPSLSNNEVNEAVHKLHVVKHKVETDRKTLSFAPLLITLIALWAAYYASPTVYSSHLYGNYAFLEDLLSGKTISHLIACALFLTTLNGLIDSFYGLYLDFNQDKRIETVEKTLNTLSQNLGLPYWDRQYSTGLKSSSFLLKINRKDTKKKGLLEKIPTPRIIKELVCVLYSHQVSVIGYSKSKLSLLLNKPLSTTQINLIKASFRNRLADLEVKDDTHKTSQKINGLFRSIDVKHEQETTTQNIIRHESIPTNTTIDFPSTIKKNKRSIENTRQNSINPLPTPETYQWPSGTYSSTENSEIVKVRGSYNLFALFKMKPEDFPQHKAYDKFKDIITYNARLVPKKEKQGIVTTGTPVKGVHGWFEAKYKAKALGAHGDIRVYAMQEHDNKGHTLLVFNTVKQRSH